MKVIRPVGKLAVLMCLVLNLEPAQLLSDKSLLLSQGYMALGPIQPLRIGIELTTLAKADCNRSVYEFSSSFILDK